MKQTPYSTRPLFYDEMSSFLNRSILIILLLLGFTGKLSAASYYTILSGSWNDPLVWNAGIVPMAFDDVTISAGTTVTVNSASCSAGIVNVNGILTVSSGTLSITASTSGTGVIVGTSGIVNIDGGNMIVGTSGNCYSTISTTNASTSQLNMLSGSLTVNGNINILVTSMFKQTGGIIRIDGNAAGIAANSVPSGTILLSIKSANVLLTGGTILIVDPHANASTTRALEFNVSSGAHCNSGVGHTIQFGDGLSTDPGGSLDGFTFNVVAGLRRMALGNFIIKGSATGLNRKVRVNNDVGILGSLTIDGVTTELDMSAKLVSVGGDVSNNGILNANGGTLAFQKFLSGVASEVTQVQHMSGNGVFKNQSSSPTANFSSLTINNSNDSGVIFLGTTWNTMSTTVSGTLSFQKGLLNILGRVFTLGNSTTSPGAMSLASGGGFAPGSTLKRWVKVDAWDYFGKIFPYYYPKTGDNRNVILSSTTNLTSPGWVQVQYNEIAGTSPLSVIMDLYPIGMRSNSNWVVSTGGGLAVSAANDARLEFGGHYIFPDNKLGSFCVTGASGPAAGTTEWIVGNGAIKKGLSTANLSQTFYPAMIRSIRSTGIGGPWESASTWEGGVVPSCTEGATIVAGSVVTVNAASANVALLQVNARGMLQIEGSTFTVGCTNNNSMFSCSGGFLMNGGALTVNGAVEIIDSANFIQNAGTITVDGNNNSGIIDNIYSVYQYVPLFYVSTNPGTVTLSGGQIIIRDPHVGSSGSSKGYSYLSGYASASLSLSMINGSPNHTLQFGDGISTATGGSAQGFLFSGAVGILGSVAINTGTSAMRVVTQVASEYAQRGDLMIQSGTFDQNAFTTYVAGNINVANNATLIASGIFRLGEIKEGDSLRPQSISIAGTGMIKNAASSPTANFESLDFRNGSPSGITINAVNNLTGLPAFTGTSTNAILFEKGLVTTSGSNVLLLGNPVIGMGNLGFTSNTKTGMTPGSTFATCFTAAQTYSFSGVFVDTFYNDRTFSIERVSPSGAGIIGVKYTDGRGVSSVSIPDGTFLVTNQYKGKWDIVTLGTTPTAGSFKLSFTMRNAFGATPLTANARITTSTGVVGNHEPGSDLPYAKRSGLTLAQLIAQSFFMGIDSGSVPYVTVASGNWNNASTWNKGMVPGSTNVVAINNLHAVSVSASASAVAGSLQINKTGSLSINGGNVSVATDLVNSGTLVLNAGGLTMGGSMVNNTDALFNMSGSGVGNIGAYLFNQGNVNIAGGSMNIAGAVSNNLGLWVDGSFSLSGGTVTIGPPGGGNMDALFYGKLTVSGGTLNINGTMNFYPQFPGSAFNQSGGNIVVDGNAGGVIGNSVSVDDNIVFMGGSSSSLNLSGGTFTIVDPHAGNNTFYGTYAFNCDVANDVNVGINHTLKLGNGVSTDPSLSPDGMIIKTSGINGSLSLGNLFIDNMSWSSSNRSVTLMERCNILGNLTIQSGGSLVLNTAASELNIFGTITKYGNFFNTNGKVVMTGSAMQILPAGFYAKLEIKNPTWVILGGTTTLSDSLILTSGKLNLGSNNLVLNNTSFASDGSATSYVVTGGSGMMLSNNIGNGGKTGNVIFPVGSSSYNPVKINNTGTADQYSVKVIDSVTTTYAATTPTGPKVTTGAVNRTWVITEAVAGGSNISVTPTWFAADELSGFTRGASYVAQHNGTTWLSTTVGVAGGTNPYAITRTGITSLSVFGIASGGTLPVELISFTGTKQKQAAQLNWITASELNNSHFVLQRSVDGKTFEEVSIVKGNGTTNNVSTYTYLDVTAGSFAKAAQTEVVYYRLVQVDFDQTTSVSDIVTINMGAAAHTMTMSAAPNPFMDITSIQVSASKAEEATMRVMDIQGKLIFEKQYQLEEGNNRFVIEELIGVPSGVYFVNMITPTETFVLRIAKIK